MNRPVKPRKINLDGAAEGEYNEPTSLDQAEELKTPSEKYIMNQKVEARYTVVDSNTFGLAKETISVLEAGVYRGKYINYDWKLFKDTVVSDEIIITSENSKKIVNQIKDFWNMEDKFKENGLLHKRGFLLTGKPGCGKSSIITAVINEAIKNNCIIFIPDSREAGNDFDSCLKKIKAVEPNKRVLIILEDFETFLENNRCTSIWLNILDGANGFNNIVYLATSNYPENIDQRFTTRPARFDTVYVIDVPGFQDRLQYIKNRNMGISDIDAHDIAKETDGMSYAHIKELLISTYLFKLDRKNTMDRMLNQEDHPISSKDFEDKKIKIGFEAPSKKETNEEIWDPEKIAAAKKQLDKLAEEGAAVKIEKEDGSIHYDFTKGKWAEKEDGR